MSTQTLLRDRGTQSANQRPESPAMPSENDIALLAYQLWTARGCPIGSPEEDWFRAEQELKSRQLFVAATATAL